MSPRRAKGRRLGRYERALYTGGARTSKAKHWENPSGSRHSRRGCPGPSLERVLWAGMHRDKSKRRDTKTLTSKGVDRRRAPRER